jgi:hypothetical protein
LPSVDLDISHLSSLHLVESHATDLESPAFAQVVVEGHFEQHFETSVAVFLTPVLLFCPLKNRITIKVSTIRPERPIMNLFI